MKKSVLMDKETRLKEGMKAPMRERLEMGDNFMRDILEKGEVLYETHRR
jgi:hypothetical protein